MKPSRQKIRTLAEFVLGIGLPLSSKLDELFEVIHAARPSDRLDVFKGMPGVRLAVARRQITYDRDDAKRILQRQLRGLAFIAVGRLEILGEQGALQLIAPQRWDNLITTWGSDTVTDDDVVLRDVHLTPTDGIGERQRNELKEYLYERSLQHVAEQGKIHSNRGGRPAEKSDMVEAWIRTKQASPEGMPAKQEAGKAQALQHFAILIDEGKISEETIRRVIKAFYSLD